MSTDDAIVDLEVKVAFQEKWISELDEVVRALRDELDQVRSELVRIGDQLAAQAGPTPDEKPPHY